MKRITLARALAAGIVMVAVLTTLSAISMPVPARKAPLVVTLVLFALLLLHAGVYEFGDRIRRQFGGGLGVYAGAQAVILFGVALAAPPPLRVLLYIVAVADLVTLSGGGSVWGTVRITIGAVVLLVLAAWVTSDLYRATTDGLILATTGLLAHAIAGLLSRTVDAPRAVPVALGGGTPPLSAREVEVLRELVRGARNGEIAATLGISERTVKAHLGSIYQKLGVTSRSAAVAAAVQGKIV